MNFEMAHVKIGQEHDQLKSFCMDFMENALLSPGGTEFFDALREKIVENCPDEKLMENPIETTIARFAYLGLFTVLDGIGQRFRDSKEME